MDRKLLELMIMKIKLDMRVLGDFDIYHEPSETAEIIKFINLDEKIKKGQYQMAWFRTRYEKNINNLWKFMTSNYTGKLMKKFGFKGVFKRNKLQNNELDWDKFLKVSFENGYLSQEELNESINIIQSVNEEAYDQIKEYI